MDNDRWPKMDCNCERCQELLDRMIMWGEGQNDLLANQALSDLDEHLRVTDHKSPDDETIKELRVTVNKLIATREFWGKSKDSNLPEQELNWLLKTVNSDDCDVAFYTQCLISSTFPRSPGSGLLLLGINVRSRYLVSCAFDEPSIVEKLSSGNSCMTA
jgi:hypothetical protein